MKALMTVVLNLVLIVVFVVDDVLCDQRLVIVVVTLVVALVVARLVAASARHGGNEGGMGEAEDVNGDGQRGGPENKYDKDAKRSRHQPQACGITARSGHHQHNHQRPRST